VVSTNRQAAVSGREPILFTTFCPQHEPWTPPIRRCNPRSTADAAKETQSTESSICIDLKPLTLDVVGMRGGQSEQSPARANLPHP
jgi:hypothetical protein